MRRVSFILMATWLLMVNITYGDTVTCDHQAVSFVKQNAVLSNSKPDQPALFILHNVAQQDFWLSHPVDPASASAGWGTFIKQNNWSAIMINSKDFTITCSKTAPGELQSLNCKDALTACQLQSANIPSNSAGNYWVIENSSYRDMLAALRKRRLL